MAADAAVNFLAAVILAVGGGGGTMVIRNYRKSNSNEQTLTTIQGNLDSVESQSQQNVRLLTGVAYTLDRMVSRINEADDLDVDVEGLAFRDDFIRGGDGENPLADGDGLGPMDGESLEEYRDRLEDQLT